MTHSSLRVLCSITLASSAAFAALAMRARHAHA